jgi:7-carboxy-7-deazaguanine synthase
MLINEIFKSIDGESKRAGQIATFIRTVGCCLRCDYCDSKYTWSARDETSNNKEMTIEDILQVCDKLNSRNITFTGGEPLLQKDSDKLINTLADNGYDVSIETCGAIDFTKRDWFINNNENVWVCVDYKCYASGEQDQMIPLEAFCKLRDRDVIKFVVGSKKDLNLAKEVINHLRNNGVKCCAYLSPVFGMIEPEQIVSFMLENNLQDNVKFQLQLHKFVWDPNKRGV